MAVSLFLVIFRGSSNKQPTRPGGRIWSRLSPSVSADILRVRPRAPLQIDPSLRCPSPRMTLHPPLLPCFPMKFYSLSVSWRQPSSLVFSCIARLSPGHPFPTFPTFLVQFLFSIPLLLRGDTFSKARGTDSPSNYALKSLPPVKMPSGTLSAREHACKREGINVQESNSSETSLTSKT